MRPAASAGLALVALALAGCGGGNEKKPDDKQVSDVVTSYARAFGDGDGDRACELLTADAREAFVKDFVAIAGTTDCPEAMEKLTVTAGPSVTGPIGDATVSDVEVEGDKATATLVADGHREEVTLEREGDEWLLTKAPGT